jgi:hypothetical protein
MDLTDAQNKIVRKGLDRKLFLFGPAGTGKTCVGVERLRFLLAQGIPADSILMLTPQRTLQEPYLEILYSPERGPGGDVSPATIGGLARRIVDLFWPLAVEAAGFAQPDRPPVFLTLETAQYYMAHLVRPLLDEGYFASLTIDRNRLYSQILDNMNKAAAVGFPHTEIGTRLDAAWLGDPSQRRVYADAQECANRFRAYCLAHNLLDFSLQLEIFSNVLWPEATVRDYLRRAYRHLIFDNLEEDIPRAHDLIRDWLPEFQSALLIYDQGGGFRRFLSADPQTGWALRELCDEQIQSNDSFVNSEGIVRLSNSLARAIDPEFSPASNPSSSGEEPGQRAFDFITARYYPELLAAIVEKISSLINDDRIPPSEIAILAPYLSDALRFALMNRLEAAGIPVRSHRPSRSLKDEPASQVLLSLAALGHPHWNIHPARFDVAHAFTLTLATDLVRAQLLAEITYRQKDLRLSAFDEIKADMRERITYLVGNKFALLRDWILNYQMTSPLPLDFFLRKLFGEVLSQPGFGFHRNLDAARVAASLIESVKKFRIAMDPSNVNRDTPDFDPGREYVSMLQDGVIAAQYLESYRAPETDAVLVSPAHTFLMMNRPVTVQFWLDIGASGWVERLFQPLTHPYVLSRGWDPSAGHQWTDSNEVQAASESLARLVGGMLSRCRERVYLGLSDLGETGFEQRGALMRAFQKVLQESGAQN